MRAGGCGSTVRSGTIITRLVVAAGTSATVDFLKAGGVFDDDFIDSYIELKMTEVIRFEHTPHPVEFEMYYSV